MEEDKYIDLQTTINEDSFEEIVGEGSVENVISD